MKRFSTIFAAAALVGGALLAPAASAQDHGHEHHAAANAAPAAASMSTGEVIKVDKAAAKITIKHGPLSNLNMPGMTMAFKVKDTAMLDQVKTGDHISFIAEKVNGAIAVTRLEAGK